MTAAAETSEGVQNGARVKALDAQILRDLETLLIDLGDPLLVADLDGQALFANAALSRLSRESAEAKAGQNIPAQLLAIANAAVSKGSGREAFRLTLGDRVRHFQVEPSLLRDARGLPAAITLRLVPDDEAEALRQRLALTNERLEDITRLVSDWVWECDREGLLTFVSDRVTATLGRHPLELRGKALEALFQEGPDREALMAAIAASRPFRGLGARSRLADGSERTFQVSGLPIFDRQSGAYLGFRGVAEDVTELTLRQKALEDAVHQAEEGSRSKSRFLANMSHELRTPLNAIIGFSEVMALEKFGPLGAERYKEYSQDINESANHLLGLINDILDMAKIESGRLELDESLVDVANCLSSAARLMRERAESAGLELTSEAPARLPQLHADSRKVRQILLNLLSNAIKFTASGGRVQMRAALESDGGLAISVADNGIGMSDADLEIALAPFGQVSSELQSKSEGTGLGLPLSRALARLHGGDLHIESAPGDGTTVTLRLPGWRLMPGVSGDET